MKVETKGRHTHTQSLPSPSLTCPIPSTDALESFKAMLSADRVPSQLAITRLVQALGSSGLVEEIRAVEALTRRLGSSLNLSSMVFVNNTALAHIKK